MNDHEEQVRNFMRSCKEEDKETYNEVCNKYPVQNSSRKHVIRNREITVGLLGLQASRISPSIAQRYDLEALIKEGPEE